MKAADKTPKQAPRSKAYAEAGVDVDLANSLVRGIGRLVKATHGPAVLGKMGGFGGLFRAAFPGMEEPVLVASIDGVGTKLKVAQMAGKHDTIGQCLVNHCVNDIAVLGAAPLFSLDYVGTGKLSGPTFHDILTGLTKACRAAGCALLGGETAEMPGIYQGEDYDLVGCIVGIVDKPRIIDGSKIKPGDVILGIESNGLHTNGYSLARKLLFDKLGLTLDSRIPNSSKPLSELLLRVHRNYQPKLAQIAPGIIKGMAHITGGGLMDNLPRILPERCVAQIDLDAWTPDPLFRFLKRSLDVPPEELYQTFNMGIGMAVVCAPEHADLLAQKLVAKKIGEIVRGTKSVKLLH